MNDTQTASETWKSLLAEEKSQSYFQQILNFLKSEQAKGKIIYPKRTDIFNAFRYTPFEDVKVVIIGQDPYHGANQAHGLCFSVQAGIKPPPSLLNIYKELESDVNFVRPDHGCLIKWAKQGVLLLNSVLTVEAGKPHSHANIGWETFTDKVIQVLNNNKKGLVFLLWGAHAQRKGASIDPTRHYILKAAHPSPYSANNGFLRCHHFSKTNRLLQKENETPIDWQL